MKFTVKIVVILFFLASGSPAKVNAQQIKAAATLDSTHVLLGDQVRLLLEIDHPVNVKVRFPEVSDTLLGKIEVIKRSGIDSAEVSKAIQKQIQALTITCFDSGAYRIPPFWFKIEVNGVRDSFATNPLDFYVHSMKIDTTRGPVDIKSPYGAPLTLKEVTPYILGIILIGALVFFALYSIKRRKKNLPLFQLPQKPKDPPHVIALRELDRIRDEKLWQRDKIKEYHSQVTETLRTYIEDRFQIPAMEQTSDETLAEFRYRRDLVSEKAFNNLGDLLKLADLVKFAKYMPLPDDNNLSLVNAYFFVNETKREEKKPEKPEEAKDEKNVEKDEVNPVNQNENV